MSRFRKNGGEERSAWRFEQPQKRSSPLRYIPHTLAWEYVESELPFFIFIAEDDTRSWVEMQQWCLEQFGKELLKDQPRQRDDRFYARFQNTLVKSKHFGRRDDARSNRMYLIKGGSWQGWRSLEPPVTYRFRETLPERGWYLFFRTERHYIAFKLRWY